MLVRLKIPLDMLERNKHNSLMNRLTSGQRDASTARDFITDLAGRLRNRVQLTTDGLKLYLNAVEDAFGGNIDYAMLVKIYGIDPRLLDTGLETEPGAASRKRSE
jgi:hypothetical protein